MKAKVKSKDDGDGDVPPKPVALAKPPKAALGKLWYLAGPFFNETQKAHAVQLAALAKKLRGDDKVAAPVDFGVTLDSEEKAVDVFQSNLASLNAAGVVLAQLEWLLPEGQENRIVEPAYTSTPWIRAEQLKGNRATACSFKSPPLNVPDAGTIWELGYAHGLREVRNANRKQPVKVPFIVAYTVGEMSRLNLMLSRSCDAYLSGWEALERFLETGELLPDELVFQGKED